MAERVRKARRNVLAGAALLAVAALAVATFIAINNLGDRLRHAEDLADTRGEQVERLGGTPAPEPGSVGPSGEPGASGRPGSPGAPGRSPTRAEVAAAVAAYLREHPPPAGRPPTMAELLTAVSGYLAENPPPAGPSGTPGEDGRDGADGRDGVDGRDGPPPSDEQVRAAVEAYLAANPLNCPAGYHTETHTVVTTDGPAEVAICVRDQED